MEPEHLHFGGGAAETVVNPVVLVLILIVGVLILVRPHKKVIAAFLAASILIPMDQVLVVGGLHFPMLRILALFGIVRLVREKGFSKGRIFSGGINKIDHSFIWLTITIGLAGILLFREVGALIFQLGNLYQAFGIYFLLRFLIRDREDVLSMVRTLAYIAPVVALVMIWEISTGHNPYAILGGARASWYANLMERDDRFRAMGCFGHPLLAGSFGAIVLPLFVMLWRDNTKYRALAAIGIVSTAVIVATSNSSTPILAYIGGIAVLCLWPIRDWMRAIRWGVVLALFCVQIAWSHPVWYLIAKVDLAGGSSSWHRFALIDQCVHHFGDWWLIGVKSTQDWGWDMWDTANWYVGICDASGLLPFILFVSILVYGFKYLGRARRISTNKKDRLFFWALGACLFANVVSFLGISYWDQTIVVWYALLASIAAVAANRAEPLRSPARVALRNTNLTEQLAEPDIANKVIETDPMRA